MTIKEPQRTEFPPRVKTSANGMFAVTEYVSLQEHAAAIAELQDALAMSSKRNAELDARYKKEHYDRVRHWEDLTEANEAIAELERKLEQINEEFIRNIITEWKHSWMNVKGTDKRDRQNYFEKAFGVDANMQYDLSRRIINALGAVRGRG